MKQIWHRMKDKLRRGPVTWFGDYPTFETAKSQCLGYSESNIARQMHRSALAVIIGEASFCRDGVTFEKIEFNWPLVAFARGLRMKLGRPLRVIDFGGAFGDTYLQNRNFLAEIVTSWSVVEQDIMLEHAAKLPAVEKLQFCGLEQASAHGADLIVLSSVLQYVDDYRAIIRNLIEINPAGFFVDRTSFVEEGRQTERITKQTVRPPIYSASYPCRFFVKSDLEKLFLPYVPVAEWAALDAANIPSRYLGLYFEKPADV